jgi:signal transduction histidine kinase
MWEKLISLIVHDLRSPLASHIFLIDHLYGNYSKLSAAETDELFFQLKESAGRISHFSSDFLTWYNSQKQGWEINRTPIELDSFLVQVSSFYKEMAHRKNLSFVYDIAEGLVVFSDEYILSIIIRNLVDNAVKYTRRGRVTIAAFRDENAVCIAIKDTGAGIPAARIKALMEYGDINKVTPTFGYLFILQFIQKLGGHISVESEPQVGTTVTIRLASL